MLTSVSVLDLVVYHGPYEWFLSFKLLDLFDSLELPGISTKTSPNSLIIQTHKKSMARIL